MGTKLKKRESSQMATSFLYSIHFLPKAFKNYQKMLNKIKDVDERSHQSLFERVQLVRRDCLRIGHLLEIQFRRHYLECGRTNRQENEAENNKENAEALVKYLALGRNERNGKFNKRIKHGMFEQNWPNQFEKIGKAEHRSQISRLQRPIIEDNYDFSLIRQSGRSKRVNKAVQTNKVASKKILRKSITVRKQPSGISDGRSQSAHSFLHSNESKSVLNREIVDHQNRPNSQPSRRPTTTPRPFQLSQRPPIPCIYADRHLCQMLEERRQKEEGNRTPFHANPIPPSTYLADQSYWIGQIRRRSRRPQSLPTPQSRPIIVGQPVPLSTYLRPSPSVLELRALRRQRESVAMLAESRGPRGLEEHSIRWHVQQRLHAERCFPPSPQPMFRAQTVPNFHRLQCEFERNLAAHRWVRPSTVPRPFRLSNGNENEGNYLRGHSCESWSDKDRQKMRWERMEAERKRLRHEREERERDKPKWK